MASKKRKRADDDDDVRSEAVEDYISDLNSALHIFYRSEHRRELLTDTMHTEGAATTEAEAQNVRTILALAEGVRLRRLDAAGRA